MARQIGTPHVRLDQQDLLACFGERIGKVDGRRALALAAHSACNTDDPALFLIRQGKSQICAQQLIRLGGGKAEPVPLHGTLFP